MQAAATAESLSHRTWGWFHLGRSLGIGPDKGRGQERKHCVLYKIIKLRIHVAKSQPALSPRSTARFTEPPACVMPTRSCRHNRGLTLLLGGGSGSRSRGAGHEGVAAAEMSSWPCRAAMTADAAVFLKLGLF